MTARVLYLGRNTPHDLRWKAALAENFDVAGMGDRGPLPDVVIYGMTGVADAGAFGAVPFIAQSWGDDLLGPNPERFAESVATAKKVCVDTEAGKVIAVSLGAAADNVVVFPWGTDLDFFEPVDRRFRNRVHAFCPRQPGIRDVKRATDEATSYGWVGTNGYASRDMMRRGYQAADVYVTAVPIDGTSVCLLEAFASGLPVIVPDNAGNREWVKTENGWLYPAGDVAALREALLACQQLSPQERHDMGLVNRALAESRADWKVHKQTLLDTVAGVVAA